MATWLPQKHRALALPWTLKIAALILFANSVFAVDNYSIVEEHQSCDHIIPRFIEQVMKQKTPNCDEQGAFPQPGNCSVFFKCVRSGTRIQPIVEYCTSGYNFVNGVCMLNRNASDCPQYTCRIPDGANEIGNELEASNNFAEKEMTAPHSTSTTEQTQKDMDEMGNSEKAPNSQDEAFLADPIHSEQLSQTDSPENVAEASRKSSGTAAHLSKLLTSFYVLLLFQF